MNSPRTSSSEAIVVSASWLSEVGENPYNLRGVATVLALAGFLKSMLTPLSSRIVVDQRQTIRSGQRISSL